MITYMFPGQGSQERGMGKELFLEFHDFVKSADDILGYSIQELCLENPDNRLKLTQYTQPALYIVNALSYFYKIKESGRKPDFVAGHSLGEYNALLASGVIDFETGLQLVKKRGELISRAAGGMMVAVLKVNEKRVKDILLLNNFDRIDIANLNSAEQTVISGQAEDINSAKDIFEKEGAICIVLKVEAAFHSRYMANVREEFAKYIQNIGFSVPQIPVISNVTALPHEMGEIKENLAKHLCAPVRWAESMKYILEQGCQDFEEVGPGKVLTNLIKKIKTETKDDLVIKSNKLF